ncbi:MAG: hypothetical protein ACFB21_04715 [Opitutales bacterium]
MRPDIRHHTLAPTCQQRLEALYEWDALQAHYRVCHFVRQLECAYLDACGQVMLFYIVQGEPVPASVAMYDFPAPFSVEAFVDREFAQMLRAQVRAHGPVYQLAG